MQPAKSAALGPCQVLQSTKTHCCAGSNFSCLHDYTGIQEACYESHAHTISYSWHAKCVSTFHGIHKLPLISFNTLICDFVWFCDISLSLSLLFLTHGNSVLFACGFHCFQVCSERRSFPWLQQCLGSQYSTDIPQKAPTAQRSSVCSVRRIQTANQRTSA